MGERDGAAMGRAWPILWALLAVAIGCGSTSVSGGDADSIVATRASDIPAAEVAAAVDALRFRVASDPRDVLAHLELARLELVAGRPGAAIRHFAIARRNDALRPDDRVALGRLLVERFHARLAHGDGDAFRDLESAARLGGDLGSGPGVDLRAEAYFLAALSALRRGNRWGRRDGLDHLGEAAKLAPDDPRHAVVAPDRAPLESLAMAGAWLHRGGASKAARQALESYVTRGGREARALRAWVAARLWWGEDRVASGLRGELIAAGVSACPFSWSGEPADSPLQVAAVDAPGCAGTLWAVAIGDPWYAELVVERAAAESWRIVDPDDAAAWSLIALRRWLAGIGSFDDRSEMLDRIDVAKVASSPELPVWAAPTLRRLAGDPTMVQALDRALAASDGLESGQRLLLAAEAALAGRSPAVVAELLAPVTGPGLASDGWLLRFLLAGPRSDSMAEILRKVTDPAVRRRLVRRHPAVAVMPPRGGRDDRAVSTVGDVVSRDEVVALAGIVAGYFRDPTVADRRAGDFVDGAPYIGQRGPVVAGLFLALGEPGRARLWWQRVVAASPRHASHVHELGAALAAAGDGEAAAVRFVAAAALSGDTGHTSLRAADELLATGHTLLAIAAGRRALPITAPVRRAPVYRVLARAMTELGRDQEAAEMGRRGGLAPKVRASGSGSGDGLPDGQSALIRAARWNPDDERILQRLAERAALASEEREAAIAGLLALALQPGLEASARGGTAGRWDEMPMSRARRWDRARRAARALRRVSAGDSHRTLRRIADRVRAVWGGANGGGAPGRVIPGAARTGR